jgi:hypothetical protein
MKKMVARLNIENFRHLLETETDEIKHRMLLRLLAEGRGHPEDTH